jgi:hypothetical protein
LSKNGEILPLKKNTATHADPKKKGKKGKKKKKENSQFLFNIHNLLNPKP